MESFFRLDQISILTAALVLLRMIGFVFTWPVFGIQNVPIHVKLLLCVVMTMLLFPVIPRDAISLQDLDNQLYLLTMKEVFLGLVLGFFCRMYFYAVSVTGQIISISIGLSSAQVFNPTLGTQSNLLEQFHLTLASVLYLFLQGHHYFLSGLVQSFTVLPLYSAHLNFAPFRDVAAMGQQILLIGMQIAAPVMISVLIANLAMGVIGKAVPQINVLVTSFPVTISLGFGCMFATMPLLVMELTNMQGELAEKLMVLMKAL